MAFSLSGKTIVSEVIDNEAIIIDMRSGNYFSTEGIGSVIWSAAIDGHDRQQLVSELAEAYPDVKNAATDTDNFLNLLIENGLIIEMEAAPANTKINWPADTYITPELSQHSDMQDLIMLDPIHEVDTMGWPTKREDTPPPPAE